MLASPLGPQTQFYEQGILIEKDSSEEEKKDLQGQGSSSNSYSQTSHESDGSIEDLIKQLDTR